MAEQTREKMNKNDLKYFKNLIIKKREEAVKEIKRLEVVTGRDLSQQRDTTLDSTYAYHMADVGTDSQEREKAFLWLSRENKYIQHLNAALDRIERGEFGNCIGCDRLISKERLEEVPHTRHCVECKNKGK